jgi:putative ABC transport system permease protein
MIFSIPLAWLQLTHQRVRFLATLAGITFVVVLLFTQVGFRQALFDSSVRVHQSLQADLFMISPQYKSITSQQSFPRNRLYQTLGVDEVASVTPLYTQFGKLKNFQDGQKYPIFIFGVDPGYTSFRLPEVTQNLDQLKLVDYTLFDKGARPEFGPIADTFQREGKVAIEIAPYNEIYEARRLEIKGLFNIGTSFGVDGNLIVNVATFFDIFKDRTTEEIDIGLITLKPNINPDSVKQKLVQSLPGDIRIMSIDDFIQKEKQYWDLRTPAGFIFKLMVIMGFIIGIGIVYQILYSNIASHLIQFATLKAIGFTNKYLLSIVFQQALMIAILGYIPGLIIAFGVYDLAKGVTRLPIVMTPDRIVLILVSVISMCLLSGVIAVNKLRSVDPADIF